MPEKFIVPQFIDKEDQILGPITVRQFLISLGSVFVIFIEYKILTFGYFIFVGLLTAGIGGLFSFVKINGQPFHIFFVNFLQTSMRPKLRVWDKSPLDAELRAFLKPHVVKVVPPPPRKERPPATRLRDLSLVVNTGGVYKPEEEL
ncbi:PrgI family protein [Patescibacteria group bacterium]|nr:PrgI family protein [Patescibacteria group bacterium]MBU1705962.1 PrgI family protein [Patescibacteria group bacterium]MBU1907796.1 PrgI family protein [Patescibacteria group bacterium]